MLYIWLDSVSQLYAEPYDGSADPWMRLLTYEDVLELPVEDILSAGYRQYSGVECIYVEYIDGSDTYVNRIYVSVSPGLLMGAEAYEDNVLIYRMYVSDLELSTPDCEHICPARLPNSGLKEQQRGENHEQLFVPVFPVHEVYDGEEEQILRVQV